MRPVSGGSFGAGRIRGGVLRALLWMLLVGIVLLAVAGNWIYRDYQRFAAATLGIAGPDLVFEIRRGDSFDAVLARLRQSGINEGHNLYWKALAWQQGVATRLQVGEYALRPGLSPVQLLDQLAQGWVIQHRFTIVEGWTMRELRLALARESALEQSIGGLPDAEVMRRLDAGGEHPEGRFLPETYHFTRGVSDLEILRRSHRAMRDTLESAWQRRAQDLPLTSPYEALILASIIEKETGVAGERAEIAGVFVRRMRLGMKLQTDPTVIYGLDASYAGNLTRRHLEQDTPYNTYTRFGLPPTPIAMPGREAIEAALHPAEGEALYFVATGNGGHVFSANLAEHNRAVARYQLRRR